MNLGEFVARLLTSTKLIQDETVEVYYLFLDNKYNEVNSPVDSAGTGDHKREPDYTLQDPEKPVNPSNRTNIEVANDCDNMALVDLRDHVIPSLVNGEDLISNNCDQSTQRPFEMNDFPDPKGTKLKANKIVRKSTDLSSETEEKKMKQPECSKTAFEFDQTHFTKNPKRQNKKKRLMKKNKPLICDYCHLAFKTRLEMLYHRIDVHSRKSLYF
ncbi:hypothetical protein J6590_002367 [Homalodisca vitripennis]|nr:hypothetical protein J6590_002367 [Homalodisca vitripennis]